MAEEVIRIHDDFYILSTSARVDNRTQVLKHNDTFAIFDRFGDIERYAIGEAGIYHQDTRFLSGLVLRLEEKSPLLLSSTIKDDNAVLAVDLMNPDVRRNEDVVIPRGSVHLFRTKILWDSTCHERIRIHNYGLSSVALRLSIEFEADFADIFEVRGVGRERRGRRFPAQILEHALLFTYEGLDGRIRHTRIDFDRPPDRLDERQAHFEILLEARAETTCRLAISCAVHESPEAVERNEGPRGRYRPAFWYEEAARDAGEALFRARAEDPEIETSHHQFNHWLKRSLDDLYMMRTETAYGPYPCAGVPWFSTPFGRDGILTAMECLWISPSIARGVLAFLAATQAFEENEEQDAQPGKILHETRAGEMAAVGEVPFSRYYGSVDSTPLFVMLAGAYYRRTGDRSFAKLIWPNVERALSWMDKYGDADGDGFVEYVRRSHGGLVQQGWKDSRDSVFHEDGTLAEGPIALCEVQGYAYAAKVTAAAMASDLGFTSRARELSSQAETLKSRFEEVFWDDDLSSYLLALDGKKKPCRVRTSNAGHCLYTGIAEPDHARRVVATLMGPSSFSGWGIRTVAASEARYNPTSYHNGSVWPHDNAVVGAGFGRYGYLEEAAKLLECLLEASLHFELHRLPELFCGFPRRPGESPTLYPVSCSPQAWAAGAVFLLFQACLGLEVRGAERKVEFSNPFLPEFLKEVRISGLRIGDAVLDLSLSRHKKDVGVNVLRREGKVSIVVIK